MQGVREGPVGHSKPVDDRVGRPSPRPHTPAGRWHVGRLTDRHTFPSPLQIFACMPPWRRGYLYSLTIAAGSAVRIAIGAPVQPVDISLLCIYQPTNWSPDSGGKQHGIISPRGQIRQPAVRRKDLFKRDETSFNDVPTVYIFMYI